MKDRSPPYTAGEFRFPVDVQRASSADDGSGGQNIVWQTALTMMCAVENAQGDEAYSDKALGRVRAVQTFKFTTWWRDDVLVTDRLIFQGQQFNIRQVNNWLLRNKFLQLVAESGVEQ